MKRKDLGQKIITIKSLGSIPATYYVRRKFGGRRLEEGVQVIERLRGDWDYASELEDGPNWIPAINRLLPQKFRSMVDATRYLQYYIAV